MAVKPLFRKNSLDEMTVRRTEKPVEGVKPVKREKIGIGSYEDPADERRQGRRSRKSGGRGIELEGKFRGQFAFCRRRALTAQGMAQRQKSKLSPGPTVTPMSRERETG